MPTRLHCPPKVAFKRRAGDPESAQGSRCGWCSASRVQVHVFTLLIKLFLFPKTCVQFFSAMCQYPGRSKWRWSPLPGRPPQTPVRTTLLRSSQDVLDPITEFCFCVVQAGEPSAPRSGRERQQAPRRWGSCLRAVPGGLSVLTRSSVFQDWGRLGVGSRHTPEASELLMLIFHQS